MGLGLGSKKVKVVSVETGEQRRMRHKLAKEKEMFGPRDKKKQWYVSRKLVEWLGCMPQKKLIIAFVAAAILALLLILLAIIMLLLKDNIEEEITTTPVIVINVTTPSILAPGVTTSSTTKAPGPSTDPTTWWYWDGDETSAPPYCNKGDYEPELCAIADSENLCGTKFAQAHCCQTCQVPKTCRDEVEGCFKVKLYGLCANEKFKSSCCASCWLLI